MSKTDYYEILGVNKNATAEDIKKAYRRLAMKFHPDRNSGEEDTEERFKEASEAYEILSDGDRRAAMVSNLLVVLCGHEGVHPVVNAGTLYS